MDEREGARRLATRLRLPFHEVEISPAEVAADFANLVACTDDPVADISGSSYFRLHRLAADSGVKVLLSGQGGDELFWGYPWVKEGARQSAEKAALLGGGDGMHSRAWWNTVRDQRPARGEQRSAGDRSWWRRPIDWRRSPWLRGAAFLRSAPDRFVFSDLVPEFRDAAVEAHRLFTERLLAAVPTGNSSLPFTRPIGDWGNVPVSISALVARTYLRANGVVQGDRLSMANSVEQRSPFLDHQLWDVVQGLRKSSSDHRLPPKSWLKQAVADIVPPELLDVAKRGFTPPGKEWATAIIGVHGEALRDGSLVREGICRPERIDQILRHPDEMYELLFKCIVLDQWILAARSAAHSHDVVGQADATALTG
jgi:asparagine synthase (glutamine-hydrolysing)